MLRSLTSNFSVPPLTLKVDLKNLLDRFSSSKRRIFNTYVLDSPCLLVLITGTSQSRQHESCMSPTAELFEVDSGRISNRHCEY
ncbi:hypothetical protein Tco_0072930 [Tanacetum coccineum]